MQNDRSRPDAAINIAGMQGWASHFERLERGKPGFIVPCNGLPQEWVEAFSNPREPICGLAMDQPRIMGVLNVTPDSFSDGGEYNLPAQAIERADDMVRFGANIIDIGGESTRPGAEFVDTQEEISRIKPIILALRKRGITTPISIDTRKSLVAQAAFDAGANLFNDVSALSYDPNSLGFAANTGAFTCLMHASGDPKTMQDNPQYDDVLLDIYDYLADRIATCIDAGLPKEKIIIDPGIGFGKSTEHNLALIRGLSLFHGLGCPILLGVSRKRFIGSIGNAPNPAERGPGSIAIALEGLRQGVQILRVHDVKETSQAVALWRAAL